MTAMLRCSMREFVSAPIGTRVVYQVHKLDQRVGPHEAGGPFSACSDAILASWASDASAIASCPSLRAPEGLKAPVTIDEILEVLCALDDGPRNPPCGKPIRLRPVERAAA